MIKYFSLLAFILLFVACNNDASPDNGAGKDSSEIEEPYVDPSTQQIISAFPEAYQFFSSKDSSFNASRFEQASTAVSDFPSLKLSDQEEKFYPYFIFNSDSTYAIDLYSYNFLLEKRNGKTVAQPAGPDTEAGLVDLKNQTRKRIYFGGSSSAILDARWINDKEFFLLTGEVIGNTKFHPEILKYDLAGDELNNFVYTDTLQVKIADYRDKRLEHP